MNVCVRICFNLRFCRCTTEFV